MIVADSHMAMVLPDDISDRISAFVAGRAGFPFIKSDELVCLMYVYGRKGGVKPEEVEEASDLAQRTAAQMVIDIDGYQNSSSGKLDPEYIRSKCLNRELQMAVDKKQFKLAADPATLSDCFAQHISFHRQQYFFGLYGPLKENELITGVRPALAGRMVMVCYNRKSESDLSMHPLIPVYAWFKEK